MEVSMAILGQSAKLSALNSVSVFELQTQSS